MELSFLIVFESKSDTFFRQFAVTRHVYLSIILKLEGRLMLASYIVPVCKTQL